MSDSTGKLLFYTDGETVWNKEHDMMENGNDLKASWIGAHVTTTQSSIIIPIPEHPEQYLLFSLQPQALTHSDGELCYSVVDMTFNGGLGSVTEKNICIADSMTEKMTAIRHGNGKDVWLVASVFTTNKVLSFLINESGVQQPIISTVGEPYRIFGYSGNAVGNMKISPTGKKIAAVRMIGRQLDLYDFDNLTGKVYNPVQVETLEDPYGVAFSPDGTKVYVSSLHHVVQYDLTSPDIADPTVLIKDNQNKLNKALQLGPDGVIYHCNYSNLNAILHPNLMGENALFARGYVDLPYESRCKYGLPNFIQSYFADLTVSPRLDVFDDKVCVGDSIKLAVTSSPTDGVKRVTWKAGDITKLYTSEVGLQTDIVFAKEGQYFTSVSVEYYDKPTVLLHDTITVYQLNSFLKSDTILCPGDTIFLSVPDKYNYEWLDYRIRNGKPYITKPGRYILKYGIGNCWTQDTLMVHTGQPKAHLGWDRYLCRKEVNELTLTTSSHSVSYEWQNGSTDATFSVTESGTYWVKVRNVCGWDADTINVSFHEDTLVTLGPDKVLCEGERVELVANGDFTSYQWESDAGGVVGYDQSLIVSDPGVYRVIANNFCGSFTDTIRVIYENYKPLELGDTVRVCIGETVSLHAGPYYHSYKWSHGYSDSVITVSETNTYQVTVENSCGTQTDEVYVEFDDPSSSFVPNVITPNQDGMNDFFVLDKKLKGCYLQIFNRWGQRIYTSPSYRNEWNASNVSPGVYSYVIKHPCLGYSIKGWLTILSQ